MMRMPKRQVHERGLEHQVYCRCTAGVLWVCPNARATLAARATFEARACLRRGMPATPYRDVVYVLLEAKARRNSRRQRQERECTCTHIKTHSTQFTLCLGVWKRAAAGGRACAGTAGAVQLHHPRRRHRGAADGVKSGAQALSQVWWLLSHQDLQHRLANPLKIH
eukprot:361515-Chlamydomonas_euryale.AAC.4